MGGKLGTEVGVNSSFVALNATKSVSIAIPWPLLPPEVGVNRHGQIFKFRPYESATEAVGDHHNHAKYLTTETLKCNYGRFS